MNKEGTHFGAGMTDENLNGGTEYSVFYVDNKYLLVIYPWLKIQARYEDDKWHLYQEAKHVKDFFSRDFPKGTTILLTFKTNDLQVAFKRFKHCVEFFTSDQA